MTRGIWKAAVVLSLWMGAPVYAQRVWQRAQDRRELRQDRRQTRDDRRDAAQIDVLIARQDAAVVAGGVGELQAIDLQFRELIRGELAEGRVEVAQDAAELRRSNREALASAGTGPAARDDRRDRRDDRRDLVEEKTSQARRGEVAAAARVLAGRIDPASVAQRRVLMVSWRALAVQELGTDGRERVEDRRELREDRR